MTEFEKQHLLNNVIQFVNLFKQEQKPRGNDKCNTFMMLFTQQLRQSLNLAKFDTAQMRVGT